MQTEQQILSSTVKYVKDRMQQDSTGHGWWHVYRVWKVALKIAEEEKDPSLDLFIIQLAALLHDVDDWKVRQPGANEDTNARALLLKAGADKGTIRKVCGIVRNVSFKGADVKDTIMSQEGKIVQDADRLDAIGAIGIARAFAYGGHKGKPIYDPEIQPKRHETFAAYRESNSTTINHFYEKLLLIKERMNTETGKKLAAERDRYIRAYLERFLKEWALEE